MPSFFELKLDTLPPQGVTFLINSGAQYTNTQAVNLTISTSDTPSDGYTMKLWGIQGAATEGAAAWETFSPSKAVNLTAGDGLKTISVKIRDNVLNESAAATAQITLDTAAPAVSITGPDVNIISKVAEKDTASFSFMSDKVFTEYTVRVVPATTSLHTAGTQIPTTGGSVNMSGSNGSGYPADTAINCTVKGADLETASAGDGVKIVKVFVKSQSNVWSEA